jgi:hypothetical protein
VPKLEEFKVEHIDLPNCELNNSTSNGVCMLLSTSSKTSVTGVFLVPCHVSFKYKRPNKKSDHIRHVIYLQYFT